MKLNKLWKGLTRAQKQAWNTWAKVNPMLLDDGRIKRVSGHKAATLVQQYRDLFGWTYAFSQTPDGYTSLLTAPFLTNEDAGLYTSGAGSILLRTLQQLNAEESNFIVWATPPVTEDVTNPTPLFRFVKVFAPEDDILIDTFLPNFKAEYVAQIGSFDGPGEDGFWEEPHYVWFRIHECFGGALGPATVFRCQILVDA